MAPLGLAVIGAGVIGARHVELALAEASCCLVSIADPAPASVELAREAGIPHYADFEEMLDRERPEAAIVAAKNGIGKTVLSDPMCFLTLASSAMLAKTRKLPRQPLRLPVRVRSGRALRGSRSCRS